MPEESLGRTPAKGTVAVRSCVRCVEQSLIAGSSNFFLCRELAAAMCKLELLPGAWAVAETRLESMQQFLR